ncbi:MAG TPA: VOC family protein [Candidatus Baltobacteraceae bacterium]
MARITGIDAFYCTVDDLERARAFYQNVLGLTPGTVTEHYTEYDLPDGNTFGIGKAPSMKSTGCPLFAVDDLEALVKQVAASGVPAGEIHDFPHCRASFCKDTEGNEFTLHQRKPPSS